MEKLRKHFGISKWIISGGSWGSTLALVYAEKYPDYVTSLILRGIFTFRKFELDWVEKKGASYFFPEEWERFVNFIPKTERGDMAKAYAKRVFGNDLLARNRAVQNADIWEMSIGNLIPKMLKMLKEVTEKEVASTKIFYHYEINNGFLEEGEILENAQRLKNIPGIIIQGRYDMICPPITAWELYKKWPKSEIKMVMGGHHNTSSALWKKFVEYTDEFANNSQTV
jgi:proline iminopeptidase